MAAKKETYTEAMKKLEAIVAKIEGGELDIDQLGENLQEAQKLIKFCKDKLYKADEEIKKMLDDGRTDEE
ncbi:exodeoxyribonuclease VII small subunit [Bacteroides caecigallinarum]|uniref:exodeoxyribonuclease VII small subunit n=1 Tax=Bacteroides caecigallinarum TaxID=1411144 RepID=UPI00195E5CE7|nr:exodeoxyribonuclease VII small subunit [Bacteroides caecigallinarum]MBM6883207.1 exodeoxyribonuclease VII small subunit [Bacteroides caecigallinarum]MBM6890199.1 exodeoxyribonuclease VII small subunit [Bacteroides caecigallinarum]MCF2552332.1 exodeoxyribonuclease VII small subunit [Bacteroides caecigallinarum]